MSGDRMRVWVFDGARTMHVETRSLVGPGPSDVRIRVARAGICGSDLHGYTGESGLRVPGVVMGHEASGIVDTLGSDVSAFQVGEHVTFAPTLPCDGSCGHVVENRCKHMRLAGVTPVFRVHFADFIVLPARRIFRLGSVSLDRGANVEPMVAGLHAARQVGVGPGANVLILGGGMIGLASALAARLEGAGTLTVSDPVAPRRQVAQAFGFRTIAPEELEGMEYFDLAIDAVGIPATLASALRAVRPGGIVCLVGLGKPRTELTIFDLVRHERSVVGSSCYSDAEFAETIEAIGDGRLDLGPLTSVLIDFEEVAEALEALASGAQSAIKVTMSTGFDEDGSSCARRPLP